MTVTNYVTTAAGNVKCEVETDHRHFNKCCKNKCLDIFR